MFLFTNYVLDPVVRHNMGMKMLYLVAFNIVVNLFILIFTLLRMICRGIRNWYVRRCNMKAMKTKVNAAKKLKAAKSTNSIEESSDSEDSSENSDSSWQSSFSDAEVDKEEANYDPSREEIR